MAQLSSLPKLSGAPFASTRAVDRLAGFCFTEEEGLGLSFFFLDDASDGSSAAPSVVVLFCFFAVSSFSRSLAIRGRATSRHS